MTDHETIVRRRLDHLVAMADQPYEVWAAEYQRAVDAYARCSEECRERAAGEPECTDTCRRADAARRKA